MAIGDIILLTMKPEFDEHLTDYVRQPGYINPTAGTSTAYTGGTTPALSAYSEGVGVTIVPHIDCGLGPTFAWGALAAVPLFKQDGTAYLAGDMVAGKPYMFRYVGTSFLADSGAGGGVGTALVITGQTEITATFAGAISKNDPVYLASISGWDDSTKLANPTTLPTGTGYGVAFSPDGVYMAVAHYATPFITIYKRNEDVFTKLANPTILPSNVGYGVAFSPDGVYMAVAHYTTPFITIYKRNGEVFTKLANPTTLPTDTGHNVAFSPDGVYMAVAHSTTPFITIYKGGLNFIQATKSANAITELWGGTYGAGYAKESGVLNDVKPVIKLWG